MAWLDFLTAPERADYVTAPPPSVWDQFMQMLDGMAGPQTATPPMLPTGTPTRGIDEGTPRDMPFPQRTGAGRTEYQPGSVSGGDFGNIMTAGIPKRQPPQVAPIGGYVQGGVARRQNNAGPLAAAALAYFGMQAAGGGGVGADAGAASALPADAAALGAEGGAALGAGAGAGGAAAQAPGFWQQFVTQTAKQAGFPDPYKANWTGADYAQTMNTLAKMGGPKRPGTAPTPMQMPQLEQPEEYKNPGPVFGHNIIPSMLDMWRPSTKNTLFPRNPYS